MKRIRNLIGLMGLMILAGESGLWAQGTETPEAKTLPYYENFARSGSWATDWVVVDENNDGAKWQLGDSYGYGDGGQYIMYPATSATGGALDWLISPLIQLKAQSDVSFYINKESYSSNETYSVWVSTTDRELNSFTRVAAGDITSNFSMNDNYSYEKVTVDLSAYDNQKVYIAIKNQTEAKQGIIRVDEFKVDGGCRVPEINGLVKADDSVTATSAQIAFAGVGTSFNVEYRPYGSDAEWQVKSEVAASPVQLTGLEPNTHYELRMKNVCGEGEESGYATGFDFTTLCVATAFPFSEDFEKVSDIPGCWDNSDFYYKNFAWADDATYGKCLSLAYHWSSSSAYANLLTPVIDIAEADRENLEVVFHYAADGTGDCKIVLLTDAWPAGETLVERLETDAENVLEKTLYLPLKECTDIEKAKTLQLRIEGKKLNSWNSGGNGLMILDLKVRQAPQCLAPVDLEVKDVAYNAAKLVWKASASAPANYRVTYYEQGKESEAKQETVSGTRTELLLEGLTQNTAYVATVVALCDEGLESGEVTVRWTTPYSCPKVEALQATVVDDAHVSLTWESAANNYKLMLRHNTETSAWQPLAENVGENRYQIEGLEATTAYWVKVQAICAADDQSLWDSVAFTTPCAVETLPFAESFELEKDTIPYCWTYTALTHSYAPDPAQWAASTEKVKTGSRSMKYDVHMPGNTALLTTPAVVMHADSLYVLRFSMYRNLGNTNEVAGIKIYTNGRPDTVGAQEVAYIHGSPQKTPVVKEVSEDHWYPYEIRFKGETGARHIVLMGIAEGGHYEMMYIDDLRLQVFQKPALAHKEMAAAICPGDVYAFGGRKLTEAGVYYDTIRADFEADTAVALTLTLYPTYRFALDTAICMGDSVVFGGKTYQDAGSYRSTYKTVDGCDSVYALTLKLNRKPSAPQIEKREEAGQIRLLAQTEASQVQWYNDNEAIAGATEKTYTVEKSGVYQATALNTCGESPLSNKIEVKLETANEGADLSRTPVVYPNPASDLVCIEAEQAIRKAEVFAQSGRRVLMQAGRHTALTLEVSALPVGVYALRLTTDAGIYTYKMVVSR